MFQHLWVRHSCFNSLVCKLFNSIYLLLEVSEKISVSIHSFIVFITNNIKEIVPTVVKAAISKLTGNAVDSIIKPKKSSPPDNEVPLEYIKLDRNLEQAHTISKRQLIDKALPGYFIHLVGILIGLAILVCPLFSMYIFSLSIKEGLILLIIPFCIAYLSRSCYEEMLCYFKKLTRAKQPCYIGQGKLMKDDGKGGCVIFQPTAACIYPCCNGKIVLTNAPPREILRLRKKFVGICSIGKEDHSYKIDNNWVAYKREFDWRSLDKRTEIK